MKKKIIGLLVLGLAVLSVKAKHSDKDCSFDKIDKNQVIIENNTKKSLFVGSFSENLSFIPFKKVRVFEAKSCMVGPYDNKRIVSIMFPSKEDEKEVRLNEHGIWLRPNKKDDTWIRLNTDPSSWSLWRKSGMSWRASIANSLAYLLVRSGEDEIQQKIIINDSNYDVIFSSKHGLIQYRFELGTDKIIGYRFVTDKARKKLVAEAKKK